MKKTIPETYHLYIIFSNLMQNNESQKYQSLHYLPSLIILKTFINLNNKK